MEITEAALERLPLHAAAVVRHGAGLVIGAHDAGKTSLACALARSGATLLSDDIAPLRPSDLTVFPFPRDLILLEGTRRTLGGLPPSPGFKCLGISLSATDHREHRPAARGSRMWPIVSPQSRGRTGCPVVKGRAGGVGMMSPRTVLRPGRCRRGAGQRLCCKSGAAARGQGQL